MVESCSTPSTWPTSGTEALSIDEHGQSCAHFNRRVGSLDGLDDRGARLTYEHSIRNQPNHNGYSMACSTVLHADKPITMDSTVLARATARAAGSHSIKIMVRPIADRMLAEGEP